MKEVSIIKFKALRIRMLECDYTQAELAKAIGIAPSTLCSRLKGDQPFTLWELAAISKVLDIAPRELPQYFMDGLQALPVSTPQGGQK